ncbi:MAG TPA: hypothetical protein VFC67_12520 [Prolixibacteraceae bacterium]|nr:hypothetical protein [Prolixibacteraceae bacterium]
MENITSATELKKVIQRLEIEQAIDGQLLKEQFYFAFESLKPVNILRNTLYEITTSPHMMDSILGTAVGLASGYVSRKIAMIGASGNLVRKFLASVMQLGVTNVVSQNPDTIKSIGQFIFQRILRKKRNEF